MKTLFTSLILVISALASYGAAPVAMGRQIHLMTNGLDSIADGSMGKPYRGWSNAVVALNAAPPGTILIVHPGDYRVTNQVSGGSFVGGSILDAPTNKTIKGMGPGTRIRFENFGITLAIRNADNIRIQDLEFRGPDNWQMSGSISCGVIQFFGTNGTVEVSDCHFINVPNQAITHLDPPRRIDRLTVDGCWFHNLGQTNASWLSQPDGSCVSGAFSNLVVRNCRSSGRIVYGVEWEMTATTPNSVGGSVINNHFQGIYSRGIMIVSSVGGLNAHFSDITVAENLFEGGHEQNPVEKQMFDLSAAKRVRVMNNTIRDWRQLSAGAYGILMRPTTNISDIEISGNLFDRVNIPIGVAELSLNNTVSNLWIHGNWFRDAGYDCISLDGGRNVDIAGNRFVNWGSLDSGNRAAVLVYGSTVACSNIFIRNNVALNDGTATGGYIVRSVAHNLKVRAQDNWSHNLAGSEYSVASITGDEFSVRHLDWNTSRAGMSLGYTNDPPTNGIITAGSVGINTNDPHAALHVVGGIVGDSVSTAGAEPGLLVLRNTNLLGAVGFTHTGSQNASNIFDFRGVTNPVAGQFLKIHEVSGNTVTLTNDTGVSGILNFFRYVAETNVVSLTVTNIPGGYNRLRCAVFGRGTNVANNESATFQVNGLTGVYHRQIGSFVASSPVAAYAATAAFGTFSATNTISTSMGQFAQVEFPEYANTTFGKVARSDQGGMLGASTSPTYAVQGHWINTTTPITSFTFTIAGAWVTNTVFTIDLLK